MFLNSLVLCAGSGHRLFLIDRKLIAPVGSDGGPVEDFNVLGATANGEKTVSCIIPLLPWRFSSTDQHRQREPWLL